MSDQATAQTAEGAPSAEHAMGIVKRNMLWSAGAGVIPVPLLELAAITAVEVKLIKELAEHYGRTFRQDLAKSAVVALVGGLGSVTLGKMVALSSLRAIPFLGHAVAMAAVPGMAAAITYGIGKVFIAHFESGGTLLDFDAAKMRDYFRSEFAAGVKETASAAPAGAGKAKPAV
jgi:uncharacterized protein (DUF697 family)